jgi:hypothetical protein
MALCPNDATITVEGEIIFQGERRSIHISIKSGKQGKFGLESVLRGEGTYSDNFALVNTDNPSKTKYRRNLVRLTMKEERCLSDSLDLALIPVSSRSTIVLVLSIVDLITSIVYSLSEDDFQNLTSTNHALHPMDRPLGGIKSLLGLSSSMVRLRDRLLQLFGSEPSITSFDIVSSYEKLKIVLSELVPGKFCTSSLCFDNHFWYNRQQPEYDHFPECPVALLWDDILNIVAVGILMLFVEHATDVCIPVSQKTEFGVFVRDAIMRRYSQQYNIEITDFEVPFGFQYTEKNLHLDIVNLVRESGNLNVNVIGVSDGAISIFPLSISTLAMGKNQSLTYLIVDGRFYDRRSHYLTVTSDGSSRRQAQMSIMDDRGPIGPSSLGVHKSLTLSVRPQPDQLVIRTMIQFAGTTIVEPDFFDLHMAYMSLLFANPCTHNPRDPLQQDNAANVMTTSVATPTAPKGKIALVLTHGSPEAQFLCGCYGTRTLFQGDSCLNCVVKEARRNGFRMIIQS